MDAEQRDEARKHLTQILSREVPTSFLRLGDGEIMYMLYRTPLETGLSPSHFERVVRAYENCSYLDLVMNQAVNREKFEQLNLHPSSRTYLNDSPETGNIIRDWTYYEFPIYISGRRCLIAGAEAALLRELYSNSEYRKLAEKFWPDQGHVLFYQVRDNGNNLDQNLDLVKADIIDIIAANNIDTLFLCLGGGTKILCYEIAEELGITAIDWGSLIRAFTYSGSRGDSQKRDYCPYFFRVPFDLYMGALESAHPEFGIETLLAKAHAQLQLELNRKEPMIGAIVFDPSPENMRNYHESFKIYKKRWIPKALGERGAIRLVLDFEIWRTERGLNSAVNKLKSIPFLKSVLRVTKPMVQQAAKLIRRDSS